MNHDLPLHLTLAMPSPKPFSVAPVSAHVLPLSTSMLPITPQERDRRGRPCLLTPTTPSHLKADAVAATPKRPALPMANTFRTFKFTQPSVADMALSWRKPVQDQSSTASSSQDAFNGFARRRAAPKQLSTPFKTPPPLFKFPQAPSKPVARFIKSTARLSRPLIPSGADESPEIQASKPLEFDMPQPKLRKSTFRQLTAISTSFDVYPENPYVGSARQRPSNNDAWEAMSCAACGNTSSQFARLEPCTHIICSSCLTGSLNVVGEKDMICMACRQAVDNFTLSNGVPSSPTNVPAGSVPNHTIPATDLGLTSGLGLTLYPPSSYAVIRIDNVPWDVTPTMLENWIGIPTHAAHVLIERKTGKTLSHAFIEALPQYVRVALRDRQNAILGKGKRARAVTLTKSTQGELMKELFPSWRGGFSGTVPTATPFSRPEVLSLLSHVELASILQLIRDADAPFLKVPSLPFHLLISLLAKFPVQHIVPSWPAERDSLFAITLAALDILISRSDDPDFDEDLFSKLGWLALKCRAFTQYQLSGIASFLDATNTPDSDSDSDDSESLAEPFSSSSGSSKQHSPIIVSSPAIRHQLDTFFPSPPGPFTCQQNSFGPSSPYDKLAMEFGIQPHLVHALAKRLSEI